MGDDQRIEAQKLAPPELWNQLAETILENTHWNWTDYDGLSCGDYDIVPIAAWVVTPSPWKDHPEIIWRRARITGFRFYHTYHEESSKGVAIEALALIGATGSTQELIAVPLCCVHNSPDSANDHCKDILEAANEKGVFPCNHRAPPSWKPLPNGGGGTA